MGHVVRLIAAISLVSSVSLADDALYRYEADVPPYHESAGWGHADPCELPCSESLEGGHFVLDWPKAADIAGYDYWIARPPDAPCPSRKPHPEPNPPI